MRLMTILFALLLGISVAYAEEDTSVTTEVLTKCPYPSRDKVNIPNGRSATEQEMVAAQSTVKGFVSAGNDYLSCLDGLEAGWGDQITEEQKAILVIFHNKMVDEMQSIADLFNAALSAYKGKR
jgi:hypothetical protein